MKFIHVSSLVGFISAQSPFSLSGNAAFFFCLKWRGNTKLINLWKKRRAVSSVSQPSPLEKDGWLLTADPLILLTDKHRQTQTQQQGNHFAQTEIRLGYSRSCRALL